MVRTALDVDFTSQDFVVLIFSHAASRRENLFGSFESCCLIVRISLSLSKVHVRIFLWVVSRLVVDVFLAGNHGKDQVSPEVAVIICHQRQSF